MTIDRTTIISGPCLIQYNSQKFWSKGDVTLTPRVTMLDIATASHGSIEQRQRDRSVIVAFEPDGRLTSGLIAVLWPYAATVHGASIFGATDVPLYIYGRDGILIEVKNAAVTKMPNLRIGTGNTPVGPVEFTGLLAKEGDPAVSADYFVVSSAAYPANADFDPSGIYTYAAQLEWMGGVAPWIACPTEGGAEIAFALSLASQTVDGFGTVDMRFNGLVVTARAVPVGPTVFDILTTQMTTGAFGSQVLWEDLVVASPDSTGLLCNLTAAEMTDAQTVWASGKNRVGQCVWRATRTFTPYAVGPPVVPSAPNPLFSISIQTPD